MDPLSVDCRQGCSNCLKVKAYLAGLGVEFESIDIGARPRARDELLKRCTWHSAQHARQIIAVLERLGIAADGPLATQDYAGLSMPAGLWE